jgi:signal transduction histidine kinase
MMLPYDTLTAEDRDLLQEFAQRMRPHRDAIVSEWVEAVARAFTPPDADRGAYRQMLVHFVGLSLGSYIEYIGAGDFEAMYRFQYESNREGVRHQLGEGAMPLYNPREVHLTMRAAQPVVSRWIERLYAGDSDRVLRVHLAQERLGSQLALLLSEAYSDEREAQLREVSEHLRRTLTVAERLSTVGQAIVRSLDAEPVLDLALRTAIQLLHADGGGICVANRDGTGLQFRRMIGADQRDLGRIVDVGHSLNGWVYRMNRPARSFRVLPEADQLRVAEGLRARGVGAALIVPLRGPHRPIGTLGISCHAKRRFSDEDEQVLQSLADYVAIALENARTHADMRDALRSAERANHAKSEFVAAVSHEVRAPLSAILGYVQFLREGAFGPLSPEQLETVARLETITQTTVRLTSDLLEHARIEAGRLPVSIEPVALPPLFDELRGTLGVLIGQRPIRFETQIASGAERVRADPVRLRQILTNLLTNAAKFTPQGTIALTAARTVPDQVALSVRDSGVGIHPQDLPRIFELFYRAEQHADVGGSGIGLFLSQQLARLMNGQLTVESQLGRGSAFTLTLPAAAE